jgi:hypothetical protein
VRGCCWAVHGSGSCTTPTLDVPPRPLADLEAETSKAGNLRMQVSYDQAADDHDAGLVSAPKRVTSSSQ